MNDQMLKKLDPYQLAMNLYKNLSNTDKAFIQRSSEPLAEQARSMLYELKKHRNDHYANQLIPILQKIKELGEG